MPRDDEEESLQESLPSQSLFIRHVEPGAGSAVQQKRALDSSTLREELMSPPPPPPPPPTKQQAATPPRGSVGRPPRSAGSSEKKPFLRKGSRTEPSALNRKSPSPVTLIPSPIDDARPIQPKPHQQSKQAAFTSIYDEEDANSSAENERSLSLTDGSGREFGSGWKAKKDLAKKELDEFLLLEQEVENMDVNPFSATKSLRLSSERLSTWSPAAAPAASVRNSLEGSASQLLPLGPAPSLADTSQIRSVRPSLSSLRPAQADSSASASASASALSSSAGTNLQSDYGIYDFDEEAAAGAAMRPALGLHSSAVENGSYELVSTRGASSTGAHSLSFSASSTEFGTGEPLVDDSKSWGRVSRPTDGSSSTDFYATSSTASWGAAQGRSSSLSQSPLNQQRQSLSSSSSSGPALRPPTSGGARPKRTTPSKSPSGRSESSQDPSDSAASSVLALQTSLREKAKELENELATYRQENAQLKTLRKQQEQAFQEVSAQRSELLKWVGEEKAKTEAWCEEQRATAQRDRRAAAKAARDARQAAGTALGGADSAAVSRKERAEIEALRATIEKLKVDAAEARKRSKVNEQRLNTLIKEQAQQSEEYQQQLLTLEGEATTLWGYLDQAAIRIPSSVVGKAMAKIKKSGAKQQPYRSTYVEEVPVDDILMGAGGSPVVVHASSSSASASLSASQDSGSAPSGPLVSAIFKSAPGSASKPTSSSSFSSQQQQQQQRSSGAGQHLHAYDPNRYALSSSASASGGGAGKSVVHELIKASANSPARNGKKTRRNHEVGGSSGGSGIRSVQPLSSSWSRSSRGSNQTHSSRYSSRDGDGEDDDGEYEEEEMYGAAVREEDEEDEEGGEDEEEDEAAEGGLGSSFRLPRDNSLSAASHSPSRSIVINTGSAGSPAPASSSSSSSSSATASASSQAATRTEEVLPDGRRVVRYRNGTVKEVLPDGSSRVLFLNGDVKTTSANGDTVVYFYAQAETTHTTYKSGLEVYEFPSGQVRRSSLSPSFFLSCHLSPYAHQLFVPSISQVEKSWLDGTKEIRFPDGTVKTISPNGESVSQFADGVVVRELRDGTRQINTLDLT